MTFVNNSYRILPIIITIKLIILAPEIFSQEREIAESPAALIKHQLMTTFSREYKNHLVPGESVGMFGTETALSSLRENAMKRQSDFRSLSSSNDSVQISSFNESWSANYNVWGPWYRDTSIYDENGRFARDSSQFWNRSVWTNAYEHFHSYDADGNLAVLLSKDWDGSEWVNDAQYLNTYDGNRMQTKYVEQHWHGGWIDYLQHNYTYDENGKLTEDLYQWWNDSTWVNATRNAYTYDTNGILTSYFSEDWHGSGWGWMRSFNYNLIYDGNGKVASTIIQGWGKNGVYYAQFVYTHNENGKLTGNLTQNRIDSVWVNSYQYIFTYDERGNQIGELFQQWGDTTWFNDRQILYTYDGNGNLTEELWQFTSPWPVGTWHNNSRTTYRWRTLVSGVENKTGSQISFKLSTNFPNPFNPETRITYTLAKASTVILTVYDVLGQRIATLVDGKSEPGEHFVNWEAQNVPSGVYFYRLTAGSYTETKKMVLMR